MLVNLNKSLQNPKIILLKFKFVMSSDIMSGAFPKRMNWERCYRWHWEDPGGCSECTFSVSEMKGYSRIELIWVSKNIYKISFTFIVYEAAPDFMPNDITNLSLTSLVGALGLSSSCSQISEVGVSYICASHKQVSTLNLKDSSKQVLSHCV